MNHSGRVRLGNSSIASGSRSGLLRRWPNNLLEKNMNVKNVLLASISFHVYCHQVAFCSGHCRLRAMSFHKYECGLLETLFSLQFHEHELIAIRAVLHEGFKNLKRFLIEEQSIEYLCPPEMLGFDDKGAYDPQSYRSVFYLKTHKDKLSESCLVEQSFLAVFCVELFERVGFFNMEDDEDYDPETIDVEDRILIGSAMLKTLMIASVNEIGVFVREHGKSLATQSEDREGLHIASNVYSAVSLFNHSCNANARFIQYGQHVVVSAVAFIPAGEEVTLSYGAKYTEHTRQQRRSMLSLEHIECRCIACTENWHLETCVCEKCRDTSNIINYNNDPNFNPIKLIRCLRENCKGNFDITKNCICTICRLPLDEARVHGIDTTIPRVIPNLDILGYATLVSIMENLRIITQHYEKNYHEICHKGSVEECMPIVAHMVQIAFLVSYYVAPPNTTKSRVERSLHLCLKNFGSILCHPNN